MSASEEGVPRAQREALREAGGSVPRQRSRRAATRDGLQRYLGATLGAALERRARERRDGNAGARGAEKPAGR